MPCCSRFAHFVVMTAEREKGGVMSKTAPTCRSQSTEGKEEDDYKACVSHHVGEVNTRFPEERVEFLLSTLHTGMPPEKHTQRNSY